MTISDERIEIGAVLAAWDQVSVLRSAQDPGAWPQLSERIAAATARYGEGELLRGTVLLIGGALHMVGAGRLGGPGFADQFTGALLDKVGLWAEQGTDFMDLADLPMVHGVVTAVFDGRDPVAWRDQAGPVPDSEPRAMACALAHIADFVDLVDGPGACEHALLTGLDRALD